MRARRAGLTHSYVRAHCRQWKLQTSVFSGSHVTAAAAFGSIHHLFILIIHNTEAARNPFGFSRTTTLRWPEHVLDHEYTIETRSDSSDIICTGKRDG